MNYQETNLWKNIQGASGSKASAHLQHQFEISRNYAKILAAEIAADTPEYTSHDITHVDALWECAETICGKEYELTPTETYVLGLSFLIHDLAMGSAATPGGFASLAQGVAWSDILTAELHAHLGRYPNAREIESPPAEIATKAKVNLLRETHAECASRIPFTEYRDKQRGEGYFLIPDPDLRNTYGNLAGRIAASHWWDVKRLRTEFGTVIGAAGDMPEEWRVDPLVLACILRTADASHLDSRRAPGFLRAIRQPTGSSRDHWVFQEKLQRPQRVDDRLVFTSASPFDKSDAEAWWLSYETLLNVNQELSAVDSLLGDLGRKRFAARAVSGIHDVDSLSQLIPTSGWYPIDAKIRVTDVVKLVKNLGGQELYGRDLSVPLREMISNATDAVRAKTCLLRAHGVPEWEINGDVTVAILEDDHGLWLSVNDSGIGMSRSVMAGALLNFGNSYWDSSEARRELPGLLSSGFRPTGQYGIGFFSIFMLGENVKVLSRRYNEGVEDTLVLEFSSGLSLRPILRKAESGERRFSSGTEVRVQISESVRDRLLRLSGYRRITLTPTLSQFCAWLCPALDVDLYTLENGKRNRVVEANDWLTLSDSDLLRRLYLDVDERHFEAMTARMSPKTETVVHDGVPIARIALSLGAVIDADEDHGDMTPSTSSRRFGAPIVVGGMRSAASFQGAAGIVVGAAARAARDSAIPVAPPSAFSEWIGRQYQAMCTGSDAPMDSELLEMTCQLLADTQELPLCEGSTGSLTYRDLVAYCQDLEEVLVLQDAVWSLFRWENSQATMDHNCLAVSLGRSEVVSGGLSFNAAAFLWGTSESPHEWLGEHTVIGRVAMAIAEAWGVPVSHIRDKWEQRGDVDQIRPVGINNGRPVRLRVSYSVRREEVEGGI
jgi:hypothetical protein